VRQESGRIASASACSHSMLVIVPALVSTSNSSVDRPNGGVADILDDARAAFPGGLGEVGRL
jgi:hypothetical protein